MTTPEPTFDARPKSLGAFYTPSTLADSLAQWLVRTGSERILEPSVGEGALAEAAVRQSKRIADGSEFRVLACDVDPHAIERLRSRHRVGYETRVVDFLQLDPASTGLFHGVLTNPPFTRNHSLEHTRRSALRARFQTSGAAGLWVHFLIHALDFLLPSGRIAAVIPASGLFTDYGQAALKRIAARFAKVEIREFVDRPLWVNDADERGALFLAEGYQQGMSALPQATRWSATGAQASSIEYANSAFDLIAIASKPLSTFADLKIGAVTGCNRVFLLSEQERVSMGIDRADVRPIASRARHIVGLKVDEAELLERAVEGQRTWLLSPRSIDAKWSGVRRQLAKVSPSRRKATLWFGKRAAWWKVDVPRCDAIFTYMNDLGPRLVIGADGIGCTNTLHSVRFDPSVSDETRMAASMSLVSTFGQLAAERIGRSYGGGVLKFELKEAKRLPVLPERPDTLQHFTEVDEALRKGDFDVARRVADQALIAPILGRDWLEAVQALQAELLERRKVRRGT